MSSIPSSVPRPSGHRPLTALAGAAAVAALVLSACSSGTAGGSSAGGAGGTSAGGTCGSVPVVAPKDPQNVLASLPPEVAAAYNGYTSELLPSAWADWKPSHPGPYKVGILWAPPVNAFQVKSLEAITSTLENSGEVEIIATLSPQSHADVPGDLQLFNQLVAQKPDLIIAEPLAPGPFVGTIDAAGQAGIPVVAAWVPTPSAYSVGVGLNNFLHGATLASRIVTQLNGKGTVLLVHGIPGGQSDSDAFAGFQAVLDACPDITVAGEVTGGFNAAATQAAALQFLSARPAPIDAVFQAGVMTTGVIQAFQQLGRPVPAIADLGSTQGSIAFAHDNAGSYTQHGSSTPDTEIGRDIAEVALRILHGDGPLLNHLVTEPGYITDDQVDAVYQEGWTLSSTDSAALPDDPFMTDEQLDAFFGGTQG